MLAALNRDGRGGLMERWGGTPRFEDPNLERASVVARTLDFLQERDEASEELAHDARNMATALELYCHLLEEPGVLTEEFRQFGSELRLVAEASRRLVDKLAALDLAGGAGGMSHRHRGLDAGPGQRERIAGADSPLSLPVANLAAEMAAKRNLLAALAGPSIVVSIDTHGGRLPVRLTREDLTRVLVNLVRNAAEAMPNGGRIALGLDEFHAGCGDGPWLVLTIADNGPGLAPGEFEAVFRPGYSTHAVRESDGAGAGRRGFGLSITRAIVEAAGGRIFAANSPRGGARFEIELPVEDG